MVTGLIWLMDSICFSSCRKPSLTTSQSEAPPPSTMSALCHWTASFMVTCIDPFNYEHPKEKLCTLFPIPSIWFKAGIQ